MTTIDVEFEWSRGRSYECGPSINDKTTEMIRQPGRARDRFSPLGIQKEQPLYLTFASLDGSPDACVSFASAWGLLATPAKAGAEEPLATWQREIKKMKSLISVVGMVRTANSRRVQMRMTSIDVALVSGAPGANPALILQPRTLLDAMIVQLAQSQASGASLHTCAQCGIWFEVGGEAKRSVARFHSDACRNRFHYAQKIKK
jgi:hypothetical protein